MIFLVDDDSDDIELVEDALYRNAYTGEIAKASNGQMLMDSLASLQNRHQCELVVLDLNMPLKNGFDVLREIKKDPALKAIPVVILTSSSRKEDEIKCIELGASFFFRKPNSIAEYNSLIRLILRILRRPTALNQTSSE